MRYLSEVKRFNLKTAVILSILLSGESIDAGKCPCDIFKDGGTPCVAAHSTVRALYESYNGPLYQVRRTSDNATIDVGVLSPGGFVNIGTQDSFLNGKAGTISIIYDQTANHNDLPKSPKALWLSNGGKEANAADGKHTVNGHVVHGIYVTGYSSNVAYRNNTAKGLAKNDEPEAMYMVVDGKRYSDQCCFDYGNATPSGNADGNGTMEAVYFGNDITWGGKGEGNGPWVAADLELGVYKSDKGGWQSQDVYTPSAKSIIANYANVMLKGPSGNHFTLKAGNAQSGTLTTMWDGKRPSGAGYSPKRLQGAIILGTGGDGSNGGTGTFFEGAMTSGVPSDAVDDSIQANIVAAGYGRTTASVRSSYVAYEQQRFPCTVQYAASAHSAAFHLYIQKAGHVRLHVYNPQGRRIAGLIDRAMPAGFHKTVWDAKRLSAGVYFWTIAIDSHEAGSGNIIIGK
jgi:non-reducing end alpha-L-arabinofuranosidase